MKFTTKLLIFWASVFLIFLLGIIFVMTVFWDVKFNFWQISVAFILNGVIPPAIITSFFYNRLEYMESENDEPPTFEGLKKMELPFKAKRSCPFDELMHKVDRQYIISYSNREKRIVKFRTDARMLSWGISGYLKMVDDTTVIAYVYPVLKNSRREELILNQTLRVLYSIFNQ